MWLVQYDFKLRYQLNFLGECILTAAYLINRTPKPLLNGKTPFEILYNRPPPVITCGLLDVSVSPITRITRETNLPREAYVVYFLGIRMGRKDGEFLILKLKKSSTLEMLCF